MISEFRKSIESILYQRVTSPFYGTLFFTWSIWNWKIWYLTIFIDKDALPSNKIDFIVSNYSNGWILVGYPIISTMIILTLLPFISNGAYWLDLNFISWRRRQKTKIENKQLLTLEKSIQLRNEISEQEDRFDKLLERKNDEIEMLRRQLSEVQQSNESDDKESKASKKSQNKIGTSYLSSDYDLLFRNKDAYNSFENVVKSIKDDKQFPSSTNPRTKDFFIVNEIVEEKEYVTGTKYYLLTDKGRLMYKDYFNLVVNKDKS